MLELTETLTDLGAVVDIYGDRATCSLDLGALARLRQGATMDLARATSVGGYIKIATGGQWLIGTVTELRGERLGGDLVVASIDFMGEGARASDGSLGSFQRGVTLYPLPGDKIYLANKPDLDRVFSPESHAHIEIGTVYPTTDVRASLLYDKMLSRHFAVLGATGSGKSTLAALILHRIIETAPEGHIVVLDPHGEYASAFASSGQVHNVDNLQIPYWVMDLEEHCEAFISENEEDRETAINIMAKCLFAARAKNSEVRNLHEITTDSPIPYVESDLIDALDEEMGRLEKRAQLQTYLRLKMNIEQLFSDSRYKFIFNVNFRQNSMTEFLSSVLRIPANGKPISIMDLSGAPSQIVKVIVSMLSRLILDFAIWAPSALRLPILLVCEEAQRYLPAIHSNSALSAERQLERIAREGRKYGVSLGLVAQRPSELSETALSQCGTVIALRLSNIDDQEKVRAILPESSRSLVELVPALQSQECIICGEGARVPVRVYIDELDSELRPASDDPVFSRLWNQGRHDNEPVVESIRRWRGER